MRYNIKWNVNILGPREGIGGNCLSKDTKMYLESTKPQGAKYSRLPLTQNGRIKHTDETGKSKAIP